eukprot:UN34454
MIFSLNWINFNGTCYYLFSGFGCLMCWLSVVQYLKFFPNAYYLISTLKMGCSNVMRFSLSILPVFLGFMFFGVAVFGAYHKYFEGPSAATVTLFAVLNGDVVHDTFVYTYDASPFISQLYLYIFICLTIYVILNIFIALVEDAFFTAKENIYKS